MAKDKRRGGRTTPKGTRPAHLRPVRDPDFEVSLVAGLIDGGARDLLDEDDPVAAETWASGMLEVFESARWQARLANQQVPPFEDALLQRCRQRRDRQALVVAVSLAAVLPPPLDDQARRVVSDLRGSVAGPAWLDAVGRGEPTRAWLVSDVFGDQDSLIVGFAQPGETGEHAIVALVDHNLSGQAKDAWIGGDLGEVVAAWQANADRHMRIDEIAADVALKRLRDAMAISDVWNGDTELRTEEFAQHRALIWARLRRAGHTHGPQEDPTEVPHTERESIVAEFLSSAPAKAVSNSVPVADVELLTSYLVDLRCDYEGRTLRWSPNVVAIILLDLAPRKLLLDPDQGAALPAVLRGFVRFAGERTGLDQVFIDEILEAVDEAEPEFLERIGDPSSAGPAKAMLAALQSRGVDLNDLDAVNATLQELVPMKLPEPLTKRRRKPTAAPAEIVVAAERTLVLTRFTTLVDFYGDGRKLTQTGQPTLADARTLVDLLGTADRFDQTHGDRTFKTTSAAELRELGYTIRWAIAAGVLRKEHGKLRATAAWRKLDAKPLQRWLKAADALPTLGPLAAFHANARYRQPDELLDELVPEILQLLRRTAMPFDAVLDWICERADVAYEWLAPYMQDPEHRRTSFRWDLDRLVRILGWAGIVDRLDATVEPDRWDPTDERPVGGTLQLTPVGRWWLATAGES